MMKRCFALILALCLVCLCGCGAEKTPAAETAQPETPAPAAETPEPALDMPAPADLSAFNGILAEIRERSRPGTAGSSLTAAELGVELLDWAMQTGMDEAQIRAAVGDYLAPMTDLERTEYALQMSSVCGAVPRLLSKDSAGLMDDIGGTEGTLWPWENVPTGKLDALFDAAGVNGPAPDPNQ